MVNVEDLLFKVNTYTRYGVRCPYYYLKLEESLRELDPDTDPNHILVEKSKNIFWLKTMESL